MHSIQEECHQSMPPFACRTNSFVLVWVTPTFKTCIYRLLIIHLWSFLDFPFVLYQNCCFASNDLLLEISLMVRMKNVQHEFVDLRQYLLENLFVIYVAMDKTQTSGKAKIYYHFNFILFFQTIVQYYSRKFTFASGFVLFLQMVLQ